MINPVMFPQESEWNIYLVFFSLGEKSSLLWLNIALVPYPFVKFRLMRNGRIFEGIGRDGYVFIYLISCAS